MSRWLKSVGNLLDGLDGTAETINQLVPTSRGAIGQILSRRGYEEEESYSDDDDDDDDDEEWDEYEDVGDEEVVHLDMEANPTTIEPLFPDALVSESDIITLEITPTNEVPCPTAGQQQEESSQARFTALSTDPESEQTAPMLDQIQRETSLSDILLFTPTPTTDEQKAESAKIAQASVSANQSPKSNVINVTASPTLNATEPQPMTVPGQIETVNVPKQEVPKTVEIKPSAPQSIPLPPVSGQSSTVMTETPPVSGNIHSNLLHNNSTSNAMIVSFQKDLKKYKIEHKKHKGEIQSLRKHVLQLNTELENAETEVIAQREELTRAAERMEKDRVKHNEEREDLMDEHDEELEQQKEQYEQQLAEQKDQYEDQLEELEERLATMEEKRTQEGGDWTKELEDAVEREREVIKKLSETKSDNMTMKSSLSKLQSQQTVLQTKLDNLTQSLQAANDRERQAEDKLDAAQSAHTRQLGMRQSREIELERTIADLGAALNVARQKEKNALFEIKVAKKTEMSTNDKEKFETAMDELESLRAQCLIETQQSFALKAELEEISRERSEEAMEALAIQRQHDRELVDLRTQVKRLQQSNKSNTTGAVAVDVNTSDAVMTMVKEAEKYQQQLTELSDQLFKQQRNFENSKHEILALKGRVSAEQARAENAETALNVSQSNSFFVDVDSGSGMAYGGAKLRRRVKGGRGDQFHTTNRARSIRSSLDLGPGRVSENMETVAVTIDAVDSFVLDTGTVLRQEPLARMFFLFYLCILHLWTFCLVIFHAHSYEQVHGDLGNLSETGGFGTADLLNTHARMSLQP